MLAKEAKEGPKKVPPPNSGGPKKPDLADEELDPSKYTENRKKFIQSIRDEKKNPYPHKFHRSHRIDQFREEYDGVCKENGAFLDGDTVTLTGRIASIRASGKKLLFIDMTGDSAKVQIMATEAHYKGTDFGELLATLKRGDIIGVEGNPGKTKNGELSLRPTKIVALSYCMHMLPRTDGTSMTLNKDTRYRQRYLDLICNNPVMKIF